MHLRYFYSLSPALFLPLSLAIGCAALLLSASLCLSRHCTLTIAGTEEEEILRAGRVREQKTAALPVRASGGDKQSDGEAVREEKAAPCFPARTEQDFVGDSSDRVSEAKGANCMGR